MAQEKKSAKKLEKINRNNIKNDDREVRKIVVADRKKELARTVSDLDDMLQGLHALNDKRIKACKFEHDQEEKLRVQLTKLQEQVKALLATNPADCSDNEMAALSARIESTRRGILRVQLEDDRTGKTSLGAVTEVVPSLLALSPWQQLKLSALLLLPLTITLLIGFTLTALTLLSLFSG